MTPDQIKENVLKAEGYAQGFADGFRSCANLVVNEQAKEEQAKKLEAPKE